MDSLESVKKTWRDTPKSHAMIHHSFIKLVNLDETLNAHRTFVENNVWGFGERSFHWMWWLIIKEMPETFTFMEIGVFKGQVLSLIELIAKAQGKKAIRYGVTPLDSSGGVWESDYKADIQTIHDKFGIAKDYNLIVGDSTDAEIIKTVKLLGLKLDILYIDGGHTYGIASSDLINYPPFIKPGGFLVIDDAANEMDMPWGYFQGIQEVTDAVKDNVLPEEFEFQWNVVHNKIFKKL